MKLDNNVMHNNKNLIEMLKQRRANLKRAIKSCERVLSDVPEGRLTVRNHLKKYPQYFFTDNAKKEMYLGKDQGELVRKLAQKEYDTKLMANLQKQLRQVERLLKTLTDDNPLKIYEGLKDQRKKLVKSRILTDEELIRKWYEENPGSMNRYEVSVIHHTNRGEIVRSKSEKILADLFLANEIPYVYEPELILDAYTEAYPDFKLLDVANRSESYHEHFGRMTDPDYVERCVHKLAEYAEAGYAVGKNLTMSFETLSCPLAKSVTDELVKVIKNAVPE